MTRFQEYLNSVRLERLRFSGKETGLFCNTENAELCLEGSHEGEGGPETFAFRRAVDGG